MATENKDFKVKNGLVVSGGGSFGDVVTVATPVDPNHAATKEYVDNISLTPGPTGPTGSDGLEVGPTEPVDPDILWLDTESPAGTGTVGPTGPAGAIGATGPTGPAGADGSNGTNGAVGATGPTGPAGANGTDGINGTAGAVGATGPTGPVTLQLNVSDDTATNSTVYPVWTASTSGATTAKVTSTKLNYNPSTGTLSSTAFSGSGASLNSLNASNVSSGTLGLTNGGTGGTTKSAAKAGIGIFVQSGTPTGAAAGDLWIW